MNGYFKCWMVAVDVLAKSIHSCPTLLTLWTIGLQAPLSMKFSGQERWSGWPWPPLGDLPDSEVEHTSLMSPELAGRSLPLVSPGKPQSARLICLLPRSAGRHSSWASPGKNTGMGCHSLFQEIFPTQGLNLCLLHCRQILY